MTPKEAGSPTAELVGGDYLVRFEARTLDDIRALGGNSVEDERKFAAVARPSEIDLGLHLTRVGTSSRQYSTCDESCEPVLAITTTSERAGRWTKTLRSRPVQRTGIISSHAILGGLHHHYVRV
jgi:Protein of unknown function (DUF3141)